MIKWCFPISFMLSGVRKCCKNIWKPEGTIINKQQQQQLIINQLRSYQLVACIEGDGNGTCSNFSRRCLRGPHNLKFKLKFCFYLRQRLTGPILTSGEGGGRGVTPLLLICKLICGSIRIVSAGGNQMTPVVAVFGSVSYFSLHRCYGASRNDPWDVLQNKSFCPPTLRFPSDGTYRATLMIRSSLSRRSE